MFIAVDLFATDMERNIQQGLDVPLWMLRLDPKNMDGVSVYEHTKPVDGY